VKAGEQPGSRRALRASGPIVGSLIVHGVLVAAGVLLRPGGESPAAEPRLEMIEVEPAIVSGEPEAPGGETAGEEAGGPAAGPLEAGPTRLRARAPERARPEVEELEVVREGDLVDARSRASRRAGPGPGGPAGIGSGAGGDGRGAGRGAGHGRATGSARPGRSHRPAVVRSRARPPRLVYPTRDREERPGEVFIVQLTINEKGYVVGVRLKQGVNRDRDEKALNAVWRFHYAPALDRDGRPVQAQIVQRFMVE